MGGLGAEAMTSNAPALRVLSLGAGVQSTTLALMAARGEIEPPDCAIFADTGAEPVAVYQHLDRLTAQLPFAVHRVMARMGPLGDAVLAAYRGETTRTASPPFFTADPDGMLPRQCTREAKVRPIVAAIRDMLGVVRGARVPAGIVVEQWLGISTDEAHRMKPAEEAWIANRWPLIEADMSRRACLRWLERAGYPKPVKSACVWCPYHDDAAWRTMKAEQPEDFAVAVAFDAAIRQGARGMNGTVYLHRSRKPLDQVDLSTWAERGQADLFGEECEGMCGT
jgi:hypothetical protein